MIETMGTGSLRRKGSGRSPFGQPMSHNTLSLKSFVTRRVPDFLGRQHYQYIEHHNTKKREEYESKISGSN